ncbi:chromosome partition protein MukE [uncultured Endozoicomonas sp.]|uniref:chromosome partition protein MukE n=1 Tax=uncultured Endozoicomonas sp. TaxID=432652 RepID=UPI0026248F64|nr:chromosome partition protein MukE [uncultured Endozoicomonas sp.]
MDNPYQQIADLINDECFPELDARLRRGEHIDARQHRLFNVIHDGLPLLVEYYLRFGCDLIHAPESYYYLRPGTGGKSLIRSRKLDELTMVVGQVLAMFHLDPEQLEGSGWISADAVYERLRLLLENDHLCQLLARKKIETQADRDKAMDTLRSSIRQLARLGMIRLEGNQANRLQTQAPLMRFIDPVRSTTSSAEATREVMEQLVRDGYISFDVDEESSTSEEVDPLAASVGETLVKETVVIAPAVEEDQEA